MIVLHISVEEFVNSSVSQSTGCPSPARSKSLQVTKCLGKASLWSDKPHNENLQLKMMSLNDDLTAES
jgi:hypothetical protein